MLNYLTAFLIGIFAFIFCSYFEYTVLQSLLLSVIAAYLPSYLNNDHLKDGRVLPSFQNHQVWDIFRDYFDGKVTVEEPLNDKQLYIFCSFPHGAYSLNHGLTMTNCCGMLSEIYRGERRDLAASIVFKIPIYREFLLALGCVDASSKTAHFNLNKGRSLLILVGGEKEQLLTRAGEHKVYLRNRKGFVKLALQHGAHLVPMYAFGENEAFRTYDLFLGLRLWLQHTFQIGLPLVLGRWGLPVPLPVPIHVEIGKPLVVERRPYEAITQTDIDTIHTSFMTEMERLFDRTKGRNGHPDAQLQII